MTRSYRQVYSSRVKRSIPGRIFFSVILVIGVVVAGIVVLSRPPVLPPVIDLHGIQALPAPKPHLLDHVPMSWGWAWRTRQAVFGVARAVDLGGAIINVKGMGIEDLGLFRARLPTFTNSSGLRVWIANNQELEILRKQFATGKRILSSPRVSTAHEIWARLSQTENVLIDGKQQQVGFDSEFLPRVHGSKIDLMMSCRSVEALTNSIGGVTNEMVEIRTNTFAARCQIADGTGVFALKESASGDENSYGIIVTAKLPNK
ncbi:MAG: hypothetical protein JWM68_552 [Verrucomicrobiales bacterium]|nr:hypothetical protein [Verrucomicrobiales bacterium]